MADNQWLAEWASHQLSILRRHDRGEKLRFADEIFDIILYTAYLKPQLEMENELELISLAK